MFIELTDRLRCPVEHAESYLVLIPDTMQGRDVVHGTLGCPVCHAEYPIVDGIVRMAPAEPPPPSVGLPATHPDAGAILAFLGIEGPGGYLAVVGDAERYATALSQLLPGVHLVVVNPPEVAASAELSVVRSARSPFKAHGLRGAVLGVPEANDPRWQEEMIRAVLPGLRVTGRGPEPAVRGFELLGAADGWWVGRAH